MKVFHIFNKDMCRALPVVYSKTVTHHDMDTFRCGLGNYRQYRHLQQLYLGPFCTYLLSVRFVPSSKAFTSEDSACFCPPGEGSCAPEGLFNVSSCQVSADTQ